MSETMRPDRTDIIATAKYMRSATEAEAIETLLAFKKGWHEADLRDIGISVETNVREIMHRLNVLAR